MSRLGQTLLLFGLVLCCGGGCSRATGQLAPPAVVCDTGSPDKGVRVRDPRRMLFAYVIGLHGEEIARCLLSDAGVSEVNGSLFFSGSNPRAGYLNLEGSSESVTQCLERVVRNSRLPMSSNLPEFYEFRMPRRIAFSGREPSPAFERPAAAMLTPQAHCRIDSECAVGSFCACGGDGCSFIPLGLAMEGQCVELSRANLCGSARAP